MGEVNLLGRTAQLGSDVATGVAEPNHCHPLPDERIGSIFQHGLHARLTLYTLGYAGYPPQTPRHP